MNKNAKITPLKNVPDTTLFPMFWVDECADIDDDYVDKLDDMLFTPLKLLKAAQWGSVRCNGLENQTIKF